MNKWHWYRILKHAHILDTPYLRLHYLIQSCSLWHLRTTIILHPSETRRTLSRPVHPAWTHWIPFDETSIVLSGDGPRCQCTSKVQATFPVRNEGHAIEGPSFLSTLKRHKQDSTNFGICPLATFTFTCWMTVEQSDETWFLDWRWGPQTFLELGFPTFPAGLEASKTKIHAHFSIFEVMMLELRSESFICKFNTCSSHLNIYQFLTGEP